jgi:hypothetical protein
MEYSGLSRAEGELREASSAAYWQAVPLAKDYFPEIQKTGARISFDGLAGFLAGIGVYGLLTRKK